MLCNSGKYQWVPNRTVQTKYCPFLSLMAISMSDGKIDITKKCLWKNILTVVIFLFAHRFVFCWTNPSETDFEEMFVAGDGQFSIRFKARAIVRSILIISLQLWTRANPTSSRPAGRCTSSGNIPTWSGTGSRSRKCCWATSRGWWIFCRKSIMPNSCSPRAIYRIVLS